jgi:hypothetical protein
MKEVYIKEAQSSFQKTTTKKKVERVDKSGLRFVEMYYFGPEN